MDTRLKTKNKVEEVAAADEIALEEEAFVEPANPNAPEVRRDQRELSDLLEFEDLIRITDEHDGLTSLIEAQKTINYQPEMPNSALHIFCLCYLTASTGGAITTEFFKNKVPEILFFPMALGVAALSILSGFIIYQRLNNSQREKFEEDRTTKIQELEHRKNELEQKLSHYETKAEKDQIVFIPWLGKSSSLGIVHSLDGDLYKTTEEYDEESAEYSERRTLTYKFQPGSFYPLISSHEVSPDDLKVRVGPMPVKVQSNGKTIFGFAIMNGESLHLYNDQDCNLLSYTCSKVELECSVINKLVPKLKKNLSVFSPYRNI